MKLVSSKPSETVDYHFSIIKDRKIKHKIDKTFGLTTWAFQVIPNVRVAKKHLMTYRNIF